MTDQAQSSRFCSCSTVPAHVSESDASSEARLREQEDADAIDGSKGEAVETVPVRFRTCSDVPTRTDVKAEESRSSSGGLRDPDSDASPDGAASSASPAGGPVDPSASLAEAPELGSLTELLPGETALFAGFTHGEDGSEVVLTDRRVMLRGAPDAKVLFSSIRLTDVDSVSISRARPRRRSLIWGLIGVGAAVGMWQALDGVGNLRLIIAAIVVLVSAVLVADYALRPPDLEVVIRGKSGSLVRIDFAQSNADVADRFAAKIVASLEVLRTV